MGMYESPIKIIESTIDSFSKAIIKKKDDAIFAEIQYSFGVDVDKDELIRALQYDRNQYEKGYWDGQRDAKNELVRCKDCAVPHNKWLGCPKLRGLVPPPDFYCAYGERKDKNG